MRTPGGCIYLARVAFDIAPSTRASVFGPAQSPSENRTSSQAFGGIPVNASIPIDPLPGIFELGDRAGQVSSWLSGLPDCSTGSVLRNPNARPGFRCGHVKKDSEIPRVGPHRFVLGLAGGCWKETRALV